MGSGMYWRKDPRSGGGSFSGPPEWPRNGAELKGVVHEVPSKPEDCAQWLEVSSYKQAGTDSWVETPGCWMQVRPHLYFSAPPPFPVRIPPARLTHTSLVRAAVRSARPFAA